MSVRRWWLRPSGFQVWVFNHRVGGSLASFGEFGDFWFHLFSKSTHLCFWSSPPPPPPLHPPLELSVLVWPKRELVFEVSNFEFPQLRNVSDRYKCRRSCNYDLMSLAIRSSEGHKNSKTGGGYAQFPVKWYVLWTFNLCHLWFNISFVLPRWPAAAIVTPLRPLHHPTPKIAW